MTEQITHLRTHKKGPKKGIKYKAGSRTKQWEQSLRLTKRALQGRITRQELSYLQRQQARLLSKAYPPTRGFLIPALITADEETHHRWEWHLKNLADKKITLPIPQIKFSDFPEPQAMKMLDKMVKIVETEGHYGSKAVELFIEWLAWGLGVKDFEKFPVTQKVHESLIKEFQIKPLLEHPSDYMARLIEKSGHSGGPGWFATPMGINKMINEIIGNKKHPWESSIDCCMGTGSMLLPASNTSLSIHGQDVSFLMVIAAKVNFTLYVPWAISPYPEEMLKELERSSTKIG